MSKLGVFGSAQATSDRYRRRLLAAAGLSNNLLFSNLNTTITIKSSPPKTARVTSQLGIISGNLTKRNEQHSWQRRFCVLAPQSLLYYFEDAEGDTPRARAAKGGREGDESARGDGREEGPVLPECRRVHALRR